MATTVSSQSNTDGVPNLAVIQATTDSATAAAATFTVGFAPRRICIENLTDSIRQDWYEGMAAGYAVQTVLNGTRSLSTTTGPTVTSSTGGGTFTVPAATMVASKSFTIIVEG